MSASRWASEIPRCRSRWGAYECAQSDGHPGLHETEGGLTRWPDGAADVAPVKLELRSRNGHWEAAVWGKAAPVLRPVPGNVRPARAATWITIDEARAELPTLLGCAVEIVMIDGQAAS